MPVNYSHWNKYIIHKYGPLATGYDIINKVPEVIDNRPKNLNLVRRIK